jgi:hypothetical protein
MTLLMTIGAEKSAMHPIFIFAPMLRKAEVVD